MKTAMIPQKKLVRYEEARAIFPQVEHELLITEGEAIPVVRALVRATVEGLEKLRPPQMEHELRV
jgi:hypothetical protein